jgi:hypothetical protein
MLSALHTCGVTNSAGMHAARVRMLSLTANFRKPCTEHSYLGAFAKLREATISLIMPVCDSVLIEQLGSRWTGFHEIWYEYFRKYVEDIRGSYNPDTNNGYFT